MNEAPYILDGLLMTDAGQKIREQYADTGGFTDHVFAVTALLGFQFIPRIRDLPVQAPLPLRSGLLPERAERADRRQDQRPSHRRELAGYPAQCGDHGVRGDATEPAPAEVRILSQAT